MRKSIRHPVPRIGFLCAALLATPPVQAVSLSPRGTGQVLLYPYYTVNGGQNTLLSLVNTTDHAKAVKLRFREGYNGREVAGFNLYLSPYDVWTGAVFATGDAGGANLLTDDRSCTVPALRDNAALPTLGDGRHYLPFSNAAYVGVYQDTGPEGVARTREGSIEVIEMGEMVSGSPSMQAVALVNGTPRDCASLVRAWNSSAYPAYWAANPDTDMSQPAGGLYGTLAVVNPAQGTIFAVAATALGGFSAYAQHTAPGNAHPDLGDARSSAKDVQPPYADADVLLDSGVVHARYVGAERAVDAVSAVLMVSELFGEWVEEPQSGAHTEWVLALPTKRHYTDPALVPNAVAPFVESFGETFSEMSFMPLYVYWADRTGQRETFLGPGFIPPGGYLYPGAPFQVTVLGDGVSRSPILKSALDWRNSDPGLIPNGAVSLSTETFRDYALPPQQLRPAQDGSVFFGLPVIGFRVVNYVNASAAPGAPVDYSAAEPLRSAVRCWRADATPCP